MSTHSKGLELRDFTSLEVELTQGLKLKDLTAKLLPSRSIGQPDCDYFLLYQKSRCCVRERRSSTIAVQSFEFYHQARPRLTLIRFGLSVHAEVGSSVVAVS